MVNEDREPWPLEPTQDDEPGGLRDVLRTFALAFAGGALTIAGLSLPPSVLIEARGATRSWALDRARRERCLELGLTPEQLEALERDGPGEPAEDPPR